MADIETRPEQEAEVYRAMATAVLFPTGLKVTGPSWLEPEASVMGTLRMRHSGVCVVSQPFLVSL